MVCSGSTKKKTPEGNGGDSNSDDHILTGTYDMFKTATIKYTTYSNGGCSQNKQEREMELDMDKPVVIAAMCIKEGILVLKDAFTNYKSPITLNISYTTEYPQKNSITDVYTSDGYTQDGSYGLALSSNLAVANSPISRTFSFVLTREIDGQNTVYNLPSFFKQNRN